MLANENFDQSEHDDLIGLLARVTMKTSDSPANVTRVCFSPTTTANFARLLPIFITACHAAPKRKDDS
jgi:hypothetical protein